MASPRIEPIRTGRSILPKRRQSNATTSSSRSRRSRPANTLTRFYSGQYLDDHTYYDHDHAAGHDDSEEESPEEDEFQSTEKQQSRRKKDGEDEEIEREAEEEPDTIPDLTGGSRNEHDLEANRPPLEKRSTNKSIKDPNLVTWEGPDDPENPKNWTKKQKWIATLVVSSFTFISPVSSSMVAPALSTIATQFNITNAAQEELVLSVFVLAYAIGPLFLGPLSELYGRVRVLQISNAFYFVFNLACGFAQNKGQLMAFRFLSGLGGSAPLAIGGGLLSDCWRAEERGQAISLYSLAPLLGPAVGPIAGGFITENTTWRWAFWATCIACAAIQISGLFFLRETYVPELLKRKKLALIKKTGNKDLHTEYDDPDRKFSKVLRTALSRPFVLIATQPIVQALAVYIAYVYGIMYLVLATFPRLFTSPQYYNESIGISGLNYISLGLGFFLGAQIGARLNDAFYRRLKAKNGGVGRSEFRVPLMFPGSALIPIGLFWYGWTAETHQHWILPNIGACIFAAGNIMVFQCCQTYVVDAYQRFAASAVASTTVLRSLCGFGFPLFAPAMYGKLGYGWGNSVLGFIALALGIPAPFLLWIYGERLRQKSKFAAGG